MPRGAWLLWFLLAPLAAQTPEYVRIPVRYLQPTVLARTLGGGRPSNAPAPATPAVATGVDGATASAPAAAPAASPSGLLPQGIYELLGDDPGGALLVIGEADAVAKLRGLVGLLDAPVRQVAIRVQIAVLRPEDAARLQVPALTSPGLLTGLPESRLPGLLAEVKRLQQTGQARLLSTQLMVANSQATEFRTAILLPGKQPREGQSPPPQGNVGLTLTLSPRIVGEPGQEGIQLLVNPELRSIVAYLEHRGAPDEPLIHTESSLAEVRVANGGTALLGGQIWRSHPGDTKTLGSLRDSPLWSPLLLGMGDDDRTLSLLILVSPRVMEG